MRVADSVVLKEPRFCGVFFGLVPGFSADVAVGCRVAAAPYPAYEYSCSPGKRSATGENRQGRINPGIGKHGALCFWRVLKDLESDGGGGRITRRVAPRPSGRCLRQRFLATLESNLGRSFSFFPALEKHGAVCFWRVLKDLEVMVVGEGLLGALRLALRVVACGNAFSLRSNRTLVEASHPSPHWKNMAHCAFGEC